MKKQKPPWIERPSEERDIKVLVSYKEKGVWISAFNYEHLPTMIIFAAVRMGETIACKQLFKNGRQIVMEQTFEAAKIEDGDELVLMDQPTDPPTTTEGA